MAVDTNFASLFDNLKLEDPWLPPRPWESIPSESGSSHSKIPISHSSIHRPVYDSPNVSESSLLRLTINALQGSESALMTIEKLSTAFLCDPADRTCHRIPSLWNRLSSTVALARILKSIGQSGCVVFLLRKFVDHFACENLNCKKPVNSEGEENQLGPDAEGRKHPPYSLVNQAFSVSVGKVLEGYMCAIDTLYSSVSLRRLSKTVDVSSSSGLGVGCLTSLVNSEVTLMEVYLHTKELRTQIEALGNICNIHDIALCFSEISLEELIVKANLKFCHFPRGGDLLTSLYKQLKVADPTHCALLKFLFVRSCEPYCELVRSWIYKAQINDPYKEFIVEYVENSPSFSPGEDESPLASIRMQDGVSVPCFLKDFSIPLIRAGQQLQVLMKLLELCNHVSTGSYTFVDILPCWTDFAGDYQYFACPLTFNKGSIEVAVCARNNYYKRMTEKLESLLTKLEIRYKQVVPHCNIPALYNNGGNLKFMKDDNFLSPSTDNRSLDVVTDTIESETSSTVDELSYEDQLESSELSSLDGLEEKSESERFIQSPNDFVAFEENYLSALNIIPRTPTDISSKEPSLIDLSNQWEGDLYGRAEALDCSTQLHDKEMDFSDNFMYPGLGKLNCSWMFGTQHIDGEYDTQRINGEYGTSWLLSDLVKHPCSVDKIPQCKSSLYRVDINSSPAECGLKVCNGNVRVTESESYLSSMIFSKSSLPEEATESSRLPSITCASSHLYILQPLEIRKYGDLLSMNPILTKNDLISKPGKRCYADHRNPFSCSDFLSVKDPCKVFMETIAASPRHQLGTGLTNFKSSNASAANIVNSHHDEELNESCEILVGNSDKTHDNLTSESKDEKQEDLVATASGGSGWQSILSCLDNTSTYGARYQRKSSVAMFETPLDFVIEKCLLQEILLQYSYVSKLTIKLLEEGFDLQEHLMALRRYHFMELADWADLFIISLSHHKWKVSEAGQLVSEIQGLLEMSVQRSSCERDQYKDRLFVYVKENGNNMMPLSTSAIGVGSFDFLGLGYRVDWPICIVLTQGALKIYSQIFNFLIRVKLAVFSLTDVWCSLKDLLHINDQNHNSELHGSGMWHFNILMRMRHQVNHFVSTLQQYVQSHLSHVSWCRFLESLRHKVKDMMDLESVHMAYLTDSLDICFLSVEMKSISSIIESILQCALDFRSCLVGASSAVGPGGDGGIMAPISRINISQVLAIKRSFDKNLKELHLCYLKTPKHKEFGLPRFWACLNYNEYYSDRNE
ncbi:hypothetical protein NMG60_11015508 [Bertholletia excelsa]